jgi:hypothetical protein
MVDKSFVIVRLDKLDKAPISMAVGKAGKGTVCISNDQYYQKFSYMSLEELGVDLSKFQRVHDSCTNCAAGHIPGKSYLHIDLI